MVPSGTFSIRATIAGDAHVVELVGPGLLGLGVPGRDHREHPLSGEHVVHEPHRPRAPDRERSQRVRERHHLLEGKHRERARDGLALALADGLLDVGALHDLDARPAVLLRRPKPPGPLPAPPARFLTRSPSARSASIGIAPSFRLDGSARGALRSQRQLDAQDPVVVGGPGLLGDRIRVQLDDAPERPGLDLDLLVDTALGLLNGPLAADQRGDGPRPRGRCCPGPRRPDRPSRSPSPDRRSNRRRLRGEKPVWAAPDRAAAPPQTLPKSSSISRRMRSKLTSRSRSRATGLP